MSVQLSEGKATDYAEEKQRKNLGLSSPFARRTKNGANLKLVIRYIANTGNEKIRSYG